MSASLWAADESLSANRSVRHQSYVTTNNQTNFTLTEFSYSVDTDSLYVYVSGVFQRPGIDYYELTPYTFQLANAVPAGTIVVAVAMVEVNATISRTIVLTETVVATEGQTVIPIGNFTYTLGGNHLKVFVNGLLQYLTDHYTETSPDSITFTAGLKAGDKVLLVTNLFVNELENSGGVGVANVVMSATDVVLTQEQYFQEIILVTGTLTSNLNLRFPEIAGEWTVINNTTGGYSVVAKTTSGSGVTLGTISQIVGDGTNIYAANPDSVQIVTNVATLRNIAPSLSRRIQTKGYSAEGDAGTAQYFAEIGAAPGTYVDNGGTIIVPNGGDGSSAWLMDISGGFTVCNFGADGTGVADCSTAVQNLINYLSSLGGGVVVFPSGKTFLINAMVKMANNVSVWAYGALIKVGPAMIGNKALFSNFSGTFDTPGTITATSNIGFYGLRVDGQNAGINGSTIPNASIQGAIICAGGWAANSGVNGLVVKDCNMYSFAGAGVMVWKSQNIDVSNNNFTNFFTNTGLSIGSSIDMHEVSSVIIAKNRINHTASGYSWHGMVVLDWDAGSSNVVIDGNIITNMNQGDGISCEGNTLANLSNGIIKGNIIKNCAGQGIGVDRCVSVTVTDNLIEDVAGPGVLFTETEYATITGNRITNSGLDGIQSASGVVRAVIANNSITGITYASGTYRGHGIEVVDTGYAGTAQVEISGNTVKDTDGAGVCCFGVNGHVHGNNVYNAGRSASNPATFRAGIASGKPSFVHGNTVVSIGNTHYAVSSTSGDTASMADNLIRGTYLTAYYFIGYRGTGIAHSISTSIEDLRYDANTNVLIGRFNGVPAGYFYKGDTLYETQPASAGYIGQVVTTTPSTWKTFGLIS